MGGMLSTSQKMTFDSVSKGITNKCILVFMKWLIFTGPAIWQDANRETLSRGTWIGPADRLPQFTPVDEKEIYFGFRLVSTRQ
jgi:hypothetical protein